MAQWVSIMNACHTGRFWLLERMLVASYEEGTWDGRAYCTIPNGSCATSGSTPLPHRPSSLLGPRSSSCIIAPPYSALPTFPRRHLLPFPPSSVPDPAAPLLPIPLPSSSVPHTPSPQHPPRSSVPDVPSSSSSPSSSPFRGGRKEEGGGGGWAGRRVTFPCAAYSCRALLARTSVRRRATMARRRTYA